MAAVSPKSPSQSNKPVKSQDEYPAFLASKRAISLHYIGNSIPPHQYSFVSYRKLIVATNMLDTQGVLSFTRIS